MSRSAAVRIWARVVDGWRDDRHSVDVRVGGAVWLLVRDYVRRRRAGQVERITTPRWFRGRRYLHSVSPSGVPAARAAPYEAMIPVEVVGPYVYQGRMMRAGDVIFVPVGDYRRYRVIGSLVRRFRRAVFRGRPYLAAVTTGEEERGCRCRKRKDARASAGMSS
jgi:hypothetical protein